VRHVDADITGRAPAGPRITPATLAFFPIRDPAAVLEV
jgi:hypothetical protein